MASKYKTKIEITSEASNKDEAMEIVGDYLSGNIASGIGMKYTTNPVRFYNNTAARITVVMILITLGFLSGVKTKAVYQPAVGICQMAAVQPPLKTSSSNAIDTQFKKEWEDKQTREALNLIKK